MKFLFMVFVLLAPTFAHKNLRENVPRPLPAEYRRDQPIQHPEGELSNDQSIQNNGQTQGRRVTVPLEKSSYDWRTHLIDPVLAKNNGQVRRTFHYERAHDDYNEWKKGNEYVYNVKLRTLSSMSTHPQSSPSKWVGVEFRGSLFLRVLDNNRLRGIFKNAEYAHIHDFMPEGFVGHLPQGVSFNKYPSIEKEFEVQMSGGLVREVFVNKDMTMDEENLLKGVLGSFQVDTSERNMVGGKYKYYDERELTGFYKKMEQDVTGSCETSYTIWPLTLKALQSSPQLAPFVNIKRLSGAKESRLVNILKTKNYANCDKRITYNFGVPEESGWEKPASDLIKRSTVYHIVTDPRNNTVYTSCITETFEANPMMREESRALVMSRVNVTLTDVQKYSGPATPLQNIRSAGSLLYSMGSKKRVSLEYVSPDSSSSSSSSEEDNIQRQGKQTRQNGENSHSNLLRENQKPKSRKRRGLLPDFKAGVENFVNVDVPNLFGLHKGHPQSNQQPASIGVNHGQQNTGSVDIHLQTGADSGKNPDILSGVKAGVDKFVNVDVPNFFGHNKGQPVTSQQSGSNTDNGNQQNTGSVDINFGSGSVNSNQQQNPDFLSGVKAGVDKFVNVDVPNFFGQNKGHPESNQQPGFNKEIGGQQNTGSVDIKLDSGSVNLNQQNPDFISGVKAGVDKFVNVDVPNFFGQNKGHPESNQQSGFNIENGGQQNTGSVDIKFGSGSVNSNQQQNPDFLSGVKSGVDKFVNVDVPNFFGQNKGHLEFNQQPGLNGAQQNTNLNGQGKNPLWYIHTRSGENEGDQNSGVVEGDQKFDVNFDFNGEKKLDSLSNVQGKNPSWYIHTRSGNNEDDQNSGVVEGDQKFDVNSDFNGEKKLDSLNNVQGKNPSWYIHTRSGDENNGQQNTGDFNGGLNFDINSNFNGEKKLDSLNNVQGKNPSWYIHTRSGNNEGDQNSGVVEGDQKFDVNSDFNGEKKLDSLSNVQGKSPSWYIHTRSGDENNDQQNTGVFNGGQSFDINSNFNGDEKLNSLNNVQGKSPSWYIHTRFGARNHRHRYDGDSSSSESSESNSNSDSDSSSSSSSSSSESSESGELKNSDAWFDFPEIRSPQINMINILHFKPKPYQEIVKMINDITKELQNPNTMPKVDSMSKINELVNWLSMYNYQQLQQIGNMLNKAGGTVGKNYARSIYLNGVVQAGTNAAFSYIKQLVLDGSLRDEEATRLISTMTRTVRTPTRRLISDFFNMAFDARVKNQPQLHSTILLGATRLINLAHINKHTAHDRYPVHMYGKFISKYDPIVTRDILPVLARELRSAVQKRDSDNILVYVRAIGNLGHPSILPVFAQYIEKRVPVTDYERLMMIMALDDLALLYPRVARYALFNIYNTRDYYEIRVAAIFKLLKANPTPNMLHQMALDSHTDRSIQVRAAIKSAITYAAGLGTEEKKFAELSKNAKAVVELLTNQNFGFQYSAKYIDYYLSKNLGVRHFQSLGLFGSEDSMFHNLFTYYSRMKFGGWMNDRKVEGSVSSVNKLYQLLEEKLFGKRRYTESAGVKGPLSPENVVKGLNIRSDSLLNPIEGNLFVKLFNQERIYTLNEDYINKFDKSAGDFVKDLKKGINYDMKHFYNDEYVEISFATITGMPLLMSSKNPTYISLKADGDFKIPAKENDYLNVTGNFHLVYANDFDGTVGFYCPFGDKYMTSGIINKFQLNLPIAYKVDLNAYKKIVSSEISPLNPNQDIELFFDSRDSYTTMRDRVSAVVPSQDKNTHFIKPLKPKYNIHSVYGKDTVGMAFEMHAIYNVKSDQNSLPYSLKDSIMTLFYPNFAQNYHNGAISIKFKPKESQNNKARFVFDYGSYYQENKDKNPWLPSSKIISSYPTEITVGNERRQNLLLNQAASGLEGYTTVVDAGVTFSGKQHAQYAFTVTSSDSEVLGKSRIVFFYNQKTVDGNQFEAYGALGTTYSTMPILNLEKSRNTKIYINYDMALKYGKQVSSGATVFVKGKMEQSKERRDYFFNSPMFVSCVFDMSKGNYLTQGCQNATEEFKMMDSLELDIGYSKIGNQARTLVDSMYRYVKHHYYYYIHENWFKPASKPGQIKVSARLNPDLTRLNATVYTPSVDIDVYNVPVYSWNRRYITKRPTVHVTDKIIDHVYNRYSTCSVDRNQITSFANVTYYYPIKDCWHVLVQNGSVINPLTNQIQFSKEQTLVLARGNGNNKELDITYTSQYGDQLRVEYKQGNGIIVNGKQETLSNGKVFTYWSKDHAMILLMAYMKQGEIYLDIGSGKLNIVTDGTRMMVMGNELYRNTTRGMCGSMSGDPETDLVTPNECYMANETLFGARWALTRAPQCSANIKQLYQKAMKEPCVNPRIAPIVVIPAVVQNEGKHDKQEPSKPKPTGTKLKCRIHYSSQYEVDETKGRICITMKPLPTCSEDCVQGDSYVSEVERICRPSTDEKFKGYVKEIDRGMNIHFGKDDQSNDRFVYLLPKICSK